MSQPSGPRAGFFPRLGAALIDGILLTALSYAALYAIGEGAYVVVSLLGGILYYVLLEGGETGQTLGKKMVGIRVVDARAAGQLGYGRAFIRYIGRYVSSVVLLLGYLWMLWDREKQTWHDKMASSYVVPAAAYAATGAGERETASVGPFER